LAALDRGVIADGRILVVNAGSSTVKLRVLDASDAVVGAIDLAADGGSAAVSELVEALRRLGPVSAVGHRVVHGGSLFTRSVRLDGDVESKLRGLADLAPLHQPRSLAAIAGVRQVLPDVPAVACFDTAFHASMPAAATTYAIPADWRNRWDLRRYGFHGLSHAYVARRVGSWFTERPAGGLRLVSCHLGAGASLAAVIDGRSVDTTMGFTPLEGLVMATRSGSVDPGLVLWLVEHAGITPTELASALEHRSGLLGLAGTDDMRRILAGAEAREPDSTLALDVYVHRLRASIAAMAASLGGVDALAFTGGVGERAPFIRALVAERLGFLGVALDPARNRAGADDREIGAVEAGVRSFVIVAREDLQIAHEVRAVLGTTDAASGGAGVA
jgi:acetate kinase